MSLGNTFYSLEYKLIKELSSIHRLLRYLGWESPSNHLLKALDQMSDRIVMKPIPFNFEDELLHKLNTSSAILTHLQWDEELISLHKARDEVMQIIDSVNDLQRSELTKCLEQKIA